MIYYYQRVREEPRPQYIKREVQKMYETREEYDAYWDNLSRDERALPEEERVRKEPVLSFPVWNGKAWVFEPIKKS